MKSSGPLQRYTPMRSSKPLKRTTAWPTPVTARSTLHADSANQRHKPKVQHRNTGPAARVLRILAARSEGLCEFWQCLDDAVHTHHRRPRRMGGSTAPDTNLASNLLRLCPTHHDWIESRRIRALELGLLLHAAADPLRAPALLRYGTVLLANDGSFRLSEVGGNDGTWTESTTNRAGVRS